MSDERLLKAGPSGRRHLPVERHDRDLVVVGGGMAGVCCAITAARQGLRTALVHDRPVPGGNASSEVRLWVLGATAHMGNNNRWAREGGVIDEILVENLYRNPEGNPHIFDSVVLDVIGAEDNLTLLLNTPAFELDVADGRIGKVRAFNPQSQTLHELTAPLFVDASGDGILGYLAGGAYRMGAEEKTEFGEANAPDDSYGHLLGHSIYYYVKDAGKPVEYIPPSWAMTDVEKKIPRHKLISPTKSGCHYWWFEYGGRMDTVTDTERIKWELWSVVYGVWDYIKNSGKFPEAQTLTLEWVGSIPGKRESRRFEGDYMLTQQDVVDRVRHQDAVAFGGWSIDLHPADGLYSPLPGSSHVHPKGVYTIPYRCLYSRNVENLFLAGRIISSSHVAFGTTRVMATCAHGGQAVAVAAAICKQRNLLPRDLAQDEALSLLQRNLLRTGQHIPGLGLDDADDLAGEATVEASGFLRLDHLPDDGEAVVLSKPTAMMIPVTTGMMPTITLHVAAERDTTLTARLLRAKRPDEYTPEVILGEAEVEVAAGEPRPVTIRFQAPIDEPRYVFLALEANPDVAVRCSRRRVTGMTMLQHRQRQEASQAGGPDIDLWCPPRRPGGQLWAARFDPPLDVFGPANVTNGFERPTSGPNAWVAEMEELPARLTLRWDEPRTLQRIELAFDTDFDHAMESVLRGHPERAMPQCVRHYRLLDQAGDIVTEVQDNHQTRNVHVLAEPLTTSALTVEVLAMHGRSPAAIFAVRCYADAGV